MYVIIGLHLICQWGSFKSTRPRQTVFWGDKIGKEGLSKINPHLARGLPLHWQELIHFKNGARLPRQLRNHGLRHAPVFGVL